MEAGADCQMERGKSKRQLANSMILIGRRGMSPELHAEYQEVIDWLTDHGVDFDKAEADLRESQRKRDEWLKPSRPKR